MQTTDQTSMTPEEQHRLVLEHLSRREDIAASTHEALKERNREWKGDPIEKVDPEIRRAAEDEFYAARGKQRYVASDGRVRWLTEEQIARRKAGRVKRTRSPYYGPVSVDKRRIVTWGFNIGAVVLAFLIAWLLVL